MTPYQSDVVMGMTLRFMREYREMDMERYLTLILIYSWVHRGKAFKIASRWVPFTVFDVVLMIGLFGTGRKVELDGEEASTKVGNMIRTRMAKWERQEMARRVPGKSGKKLNQNPTRPELLTELIHVHITNTFSITGCRAFYDQSAAWPSLRIRT